MHEIVAARIGNTITNRRSDIIAALESGRKDIEWLDRRRMQFMASADLGERWERFAKSPTLFVLDDNWDLIEIQKEKLLQYTNKRENGLDCPMGGTLQ